MKVRCPLSVNPGLAALAPAPSVAGNWLGSLEVKDNALVR